MMRHFLLISSLIASAQLHAADRSDEKIAKRTARLESEMQEILTDTAYGDFGAKTAAARPQIISKRIFVKGDALLWKAFFGGNDFAISNTAVPLTGILTGDTKRADFRWRWGFRAELGAHLPHDNWDALANYTFYQSKSDNSLSSPNGGTIVPLLSYFAEFNPNASGSVDWHLSFQNCDVDLRKSYFLSNSFSVAPFFGLRNTWIRQGYHAHYFDPTASLTLDVKADQKFWGIGPLAGFGTEWHLGKHFRFFNSFAGAVLAADYKIENTSSSNGARQTDLNGNTQRMSPTLQGSLGLGWQTNFNRSRNHVALNVSYEAQYLWKQNLTINYDTASYQVARNGEDLGLHGFTLDLLLDF